MSYKITEGFDVKLKEIPMKNDLQPWPNRPSTSAYLFM